MQGHQTLLVINDFLTAPHSRYKSANFTSFVPSKIFLFLLNIYLWIIALNSLSDKTGKYSSGTLHTEYDDWLKEKDLWGFELGDELADFFHGTLFLLKRIIDDGYSS